MKTRDANKLAKSLQARFAVYFTNNYWIVAGQHWKQTPDAPEQVAMNSIKTTCTHSNKMDKVFGIKGLPIFRFEVEANAPKYVRPAFHPSQLRRELNQFFGGKLTLVNDDVDFNHGVLSLVMRQKGQKNTMFFHFTLG